MAKGYTKNQHTVPKCYLKNFSDTGHNLYKKEIAYNTTGHAIKKDLKTPVPLKKATVVQDFYTVKSGNNPMLIETLIYANEIENRYPSVYKLLIDESRSTFDMKERTWMLSCLLSLHCRTPRQFNLFFENIPKEYSYEIDKIKEDYKSAHVRYTLTKFIETHQFKRVIVAKINSTAEFITSDNPVLIVGAGNSIMNGNFQEQFNSENLIFIPLDKKHCFILTPTKDRNGITAEGKLFYNKIERKDVKEIDPNLPFNLNMMTLNNAHKYCYGSEKYLDGFFSFVMGLNE